MSQERSKPSGCGRSIALRVGSRSCTRLWAACALLIWISASGAGCPHVLQQYTQPIPRALPPQASLDQVIDVVNDNSARVQSMSATRATVTAPGYPALNANIAFLRPKSFRMVAQKFIGPELDLGSNDEVLWFWIRRAQPPALYFCRHEQFNTSAARQILPVEPEWLIEALGVITLDKNAPIEGPFPVGSRRVEIRTRSSMPTGPVSRTVIIDDSRGVVLEDHIYDAQGVRLATAVMSKHTLDPGSGAKLPRHVEIQLPPAGLTLSVDLGEVQVNQLSAEPREVFAKPSYSGFNEIDLAQPGGLVPVAPPRPARRNSRRAERALSGNGAVIPVVCQQNSSLGAMLTLREHDELESAEEHACEAQAWHPARSKRQTTSRFRDSRKARQGRGATCRSTCRRRRLSTWPVTIAEPVTRLMIAAATSAGSHTFSNGHDCATVCFAPS